MSPPLGRGRELAAAQAGEQLGAERGEHVN